MSYVIVKWIEKKGTHLPVILLDSNAEIWEFENGAEATEMALRLETNSHTNTKYTVKEV
jgi:hypothetical protein